jgi:hypothetical protein
LICIEQPDKTRACSNDLSRVTGKTPEVGGEEDAAPARDAEAGRPDATTPPRDSSVPETNVPDAAPVDSGEDDG